MVDNKEKVPILLLFSAFAVATSGLIYELIAGALASYLLGDSVTQFSIIIGLYLFSMGIGSYFSKYFESNLLKSFIQIELLIGFVGGITSSVLFLIFNRVESFQWVLYGLIAITGILVGLEIPLLMQILNKSQIAFKEIVSKVFTFDYIGALLASILFPIIFMPKMGLIKTSFFFGILNTLVAIIVLYKYQSHIKQKFAVWMQAILIFIFLLSGFIYSEKITNYSEAMLYDDKIIFARSSPYQRIVITRNDANYKLFLNKNLQFNSFDEYRYHEALVHPIMAFAQKTEHLLILGGGDGMAVRELLKYPSVKSIILVDLDPMITKLFKENELLTKLNNNSLNNRKVKVLNEDAFLWIKKNKQIFDVIIIDFPDPNNYSLGKLYTNTFYNEVAEKLSRNGIFVVQSTSPFMARKAFWCVNNTINSAGFSTLPYHIFVPSFGDWGYVLASKKELKKVKPIINSQRFINEQTFRQSQYFPKDISWVRTKINRLNNQVLVQYFEEEWSKEM